jgi:hypothetical protein
MLRRKCEEKCRWIIIYHQALCASSFTLHWFQLFPLRIVLLTLRSINATCETGESRDSVVSPIQCMWTCSSAYALALHAYVIPAVRQLLGKPSRRFLNTITGLATNSCIWTYWKLAQYKIQEFIVNCGSSDPEFHRVWRNQGFMRNCQLVEPQLLLMHQILDHVILKGRAFNDPCNGTVLELLQFIDHSFNKHRKHLILHSKYKKASQRHIIVVIWIQKDGLSCHYSPAKIKCSSLGVEIIYIFGVYIIICESRDRAVRDWLLSARPRGWSSSPGGGKNFYFFMSSRPVLGPTQPPI